MFNFHSLTEVRTPITKVLLVCDCHSFKTVTVDGHWTLEELRPKPSVPESDREFFKKLGVKI